MVRRDLPEQVKQQVSRLMTESVQQARNNPDQTRPYVRQYAQEMDEDVMYEHINLYVNEYTQNLGERGRQAIELMFKRAGEKDIIPAVRQPLFVS